MAGNGLLPLNWKLFKAIKIEDGRKIIANYGLDPKLGKYNRSFCEDCNCSIETNPPAIKCDKCGGTTPLYDSFFDQSGSYGGFREYRGGYCI